ncbi:polysaccharide pyruvyl transferase family protein [Butyrivibrio sp. WCD3002]|uniref:polysaccharide pyruvyl transferase family protein n=1 Tax=Butyrivibrio sp. WCD3002 TaxID=1280676 RepID=UPI0004154311|nr:polysaccharide pyruvyl transferase family protein [Butyrivibrio sp. WCD3002]
MKIGILTFHRAYNYGAFLQCYALMCSLQSQGHYVEVIDFTPSYLMDGYKKIRLFEKKRIETNNQLLFFIKDTLYKIINWNYIKSRNAFEIIRNHSIDSSIGILNLSEEGVISDELEVFQRQVANKYDAIIVGSDAVWNDYQTQCPYVYYLENVDCKYKISFSASAYGMSYERKTDNQLNRIKTDLLEFDLLSCRDSYTEKYISNLLGKDIFHVCDPTLLLDIKKFSKYKDAGKNKLENAGVNFEKKLIFLMGDNKLGKELRKNIDSNDYMIIGVYNYNKYADVNVSELNPLEWAAVFPFFDFTVTTYFHCTIFSLLNGVPTIAVDKRTDFSSVHKSKIRDLLERLNLMESYLSSDDISVKLPEVLESIMKSSDIEVWRKKVINSIDAERESALAYIQLIGKLEG